MARQPEPFPLATLFVHDGCTAYGWDYNQNLLMRCESDPAKKPPNSLGLLEKPPELAFTFGDCAGYRFEYHDTWYYMRCGLDLTKAIQKQPEGAFEFLFAQDGCEAFRFKHDGGRYLVRCGYSSLATGNGTLEDPPEKVLNQDGCRGYTFDDHGSHFFASCDDTPVTYMIRDVNCAAKSEDRVTHMRNDCSIGEGSVAVSAKNTP
jgi:hypothetical protein